MFQKLLIAALIGLALGAPSNKVDDALSQTLASEGKANVIVTFSQSTDAVLRKVSSMKFESRGAKITSMKSQLENLAASSQRNVISLLKSREVKFQSFWISNILFIANAEPELVAAIAGIAEVENIREEKIVYIDEPIPADNQINAEWGVEIIEAEAAWNLPGGNNGQGVVVSHIDTGVRYTHQDVRANFRSSYGWYDPYARTQTPVDQNGHGTHTMGTIIGANGIGVAPGAQWMSCRGCQTSSCSESGLTSCGQFIACPTLPNGQTPDCHQAPNLVSNSWGGGQGDNWYNSVVEAWHTAGIIPLFSQGNSGSSCGTANSPGDYENVIGVGSTTNTDDISDFSSRGPSTSGLLKPDISAPGSNVRSAWYTGDDSYNTISGTSMACPHAAGVTALLLAQNPSLTYVQVKDLLQDNTDRSLGPATTCGGTPPTEFPNNIYGYGRINARKSLTAAIGGKL